MIQSGVELDCIEATVLSSSAAMGYLADLRGARFTRVIRGLRETFGEHRFSLSVDDAHWSMRMAHSIYFISHRKPRHSGAVSGFIGNGTRNLLLKAAAAKSRLTRRIPREALAAWAAYQETGKHLTSKQAQDWLRAWVTKAERAAPKCRG